MWKKPTDWNSVPESSSFDRPPYGGYVCIIRKVTDLADKQCFEIDFDIAEGEYKGYALNIMEKFGNWPLSFKKSYKETAYGFLRHFQHVIERTNNMPEDTWDGNPQSWVGKGIGIVFSERQYYGKDGTLKKALDFNTFCTAAEIRNGEYTIPEPKLPKDAPQTSYAPTFTEVAASDDGELPF